MPWGSWVYADGGPHTRQGSPVTAGRRTVPTPRSPTRRRQQQSSAGLETPECPEDAFPIAATELFVGAVIFPNVEVS